MKQSEKESVNLQSKKIETSTLSQRPSRLEDAGTFQKSVQKECSTTFEQLSKNNRESLEKNPVETVPIEFDRLTDDDWPFLDEARIFGDYDAAVGLRSSELISFAKSSWATKNGYLPPKEVTAAMTLGTAFHRYILEPELFEQEYVTFHAPINPGTGKAYGAGTKKYEEALAEQSNGRKALTPAEETRFAIARTGMQESGILQIINSAKREVPLAKLFKNDRVRKCKIDILSKEYGIIDLKTTGLDLTNIYQEDCFRWEIRRRGYIEQLAWYQSIIRAITGKTIACRLAVVQIYPPYDIAIYAFSPKTMTEAVERVNSWENVFYRKNQCAKSMLNWIY